MISSKIIVILTVISIIYGYDRLASNGEKAMKARTWKPARQWFREMMKDTQSKHLHFEETSNILPKMNTHSNRKNFQRNANFDNGIAQDVKLTFQSICPTIVTLVNLTDETMYWYRPAGYKEIRCAYPSAEMNYKNKVCALNNFQCIQLYTNIFLTKIRADGSSNCAENETRNIPSGCECMRPVGGLQFDNDDDYDLNNN